MTEKRDLIVGTLVGLLLLVGIVGCATEDPEPTPVTQPTGEASPIEDVNTRSFDTGFGVVTAEGEVKPVRSAELSFVTGGNVSEILVGEGDEVSAGDPLLRLESTQLENALRQAEAGKVAAEAALSAANARLAVAQAGIQRAEAEKKAAEARLALTRSGATPEEIAAAENNLAAAEAAIVQAAGNRDAAVRVSDAQVQAAQAQVAAAQAEVNQLQEAYDDIIDACFELPDGSEICPLYGPVEENTRFQLEAAKANLTAAQSAESEARAGATPAEAYLAGTGITMAEAQRDQAQAQKDLLLAGAREEQIQQAQVGVDQADVGIQQALVQVSQAEAAVTQAEAGVVKADADVLAAQKALERMTLLAPFDGHVGELLTEVGELVTPGTAVVRFGDIGSWLVETTDLTELDVVAVKLGLPVEVRIDAVPGEVISGEVTDIAAVSQLIRGDVTYPVSVRLENTNLPLRWGMTATVDIETEP